jgi:lipopolysaccharide/colanic/teichoic acid biosynthesis glycosyltransferase
MAIEDTFIRGYRQLALEAPQRPRDRFLRLLDVTLSAVFLLVALPIVLLLTNSTSFRSSSTSCEAT